MPVTSWVVCGGAPGELGFELLVQLGEAKPRELAARVQSQPALNFSSSLN